VFTRRCSLMMRIALVLNGPAIAASSRCLLISCSSLCLLSSSLCLFGISHQFPGCRWWLLSTRAIPASPIANPWRSAGVSPFSS
jgi:hypothetical protein